MDIYVKCQIIYVYVKLDKDWDLPIGFDKMEVIYNLNKSPVNNLITV